MQGPSARQYEELEQCPHFALTEQILAAAYKVHTALGPGYVEKIYENALVRALNKLGLQVGQQVKYPVLFEGELVGQHVMDLVVDSKVYVELKVVELTSLERAQTISGLKASGIEIALLLNFNTLHLKNQVDRLLNPDILRTFKSQRKS